MDRLKISMSQLCEVLPLYKGISGIYVFKNRKVTYYVGQAKCLHKRLTEYVNLNEKRVNKPMEYLIGKDVEYNNLQVILIPIPVEELRQVEKEIIQRSCPWVNLHHNPRFSLKSIQDVIGNHVAKVGETSFNSVKTYLYKFYWKEAIAMELIEEALHDSDNLQRYVCYNRKKQILRPKKATS